MKSININDKDYLVPESWGDITIYQYKKICDLELNDELTELQKAIAIIGAIINEPPAFFYKLTVTKCNELIEAIQFLAIPYIFEEDNREFITIGDKTYYIDKDLDKMTMGEQISYQLYCQKSKQRIIDCLAPALSIFLKEDLNEEFDDKEYLNKIKYIEENMNYSQAMNTSAFFLLGLTE